ncbi:GHKL domain-containing protein [Bacillus infantis]|uniref:histidine kinase n=1 Tax=Bacillus infantis TaxID=324767 RepID=A0A5D4SPV7_9BACI|nr:ATP-binding protein [Bacillus infantis]TYS65330.1 GHKL domain-containing protein [Bacillus infantis]
MIPVNSLSHESFPFPYFILSRDLYIISASGNQQQHCQKHISELLADGQNAQELQAFLLGSNAEYVDFHFIEGWFRIYRADGADNETIHIFCFPIEPLAAEIEQVLAEFEEKAAVFSKALKKKKEKLIQTAEQVQEMAVAYEFQANLGKLAAGIAHEIRNPLTTVKGFLQLLKPQLREIGKEEYASIALGEISRANEIIGSFLNANKPSENKMKKVHINQIVKEIVMLYESEAVLRGSLLLFEPSPNDPTMAAVPGELKQVLSNLFKNAMEAMTIQSMAGSVQAKVECCSKHAVITIQDNGCGMSEETLQRIYEPFYTTKETGTGIGMSVCKKIVEELGGSIDISSRPGEGTAVKVILPIEAEEAEKLAEPEIIPERRN